MGVAAVAGPGEARSVVVVGRGKNDGHSPEGKLSCFPSECQDRKLSSEAYMVESLVVSRHSPVRGLRHAVEGSR